jgi:hypothetical protein
MTEPGRQQWQARLDVVAVAVPIDQRGCDERVPQIMEPGRSAPGLSGDPGSGDDLPEGNAQPVRAERCASGIDEDGRAGTYRGPDPRLACLQVVG